MKYTRQPKPHRQNALFKSARIKRTWNPRFPFVALALLGFFLISSGPAMAIVTHFHGGQDNSGGTADNVVDLGAGWQDNYIEEDNPDTNRGTSFSVAVAKGTNTSQFSPEGHQQFAMISFGNLQTTLGTDTINSATLSLNIESWNGTNTFHIYGYSGTTAVNSMTYNNAFSGINS